MIVTIDQNDNVIVGETVNVNIDWGGDSKIPLLNFPNEILKKVATRLYIGSAHIGGKVSPNSVVNGYTEIVQDGHLLDHIHVMQRKVAGMTGRTSIGMGLKNQSLLGS